MKQIFLNINDQIGFTYYRNIIDFLSGRVVRTVTLVGICNKIIDEVQKHDDLRMSRL